MSRQVGANRGAVAQGGNNNRAGRNNKNASLPVRAGPSTSKAPSSTSKAPSPTSELEQFKNDYVKLTRKQNTINENLLNNLKNVLEDKYGFKIHGKTTSYKTFLDTMKKQITNNSIKKEIGRLTTISDIAIITKTLKKYGEKYGATNNHIVNHVIKRKILNIESIENLNKTRNLLSDILKLPNLELSNRDKIINYIKKTYGSKYEKYIAKTIECILNIKKVIKSKKYNLQDKIFYILDYIQISDLKAYKKQLESVKKSKKELLEITYLYLLRRIINTQANKPFIQHVLKHTKIKNKKITEIPSENLDRIHNAIIKKKERDLGRVFSINININDFFLMMAKDMIHDMKKINKEKFKEIFSSIENKIFKINFKNDNFKKDIYDKLWKDLDQYLVNNNSIYSGDLSSKLEESMKNELFAKLNQKVNNGKGFTINISSQGNLLSRTSKNLIAYKLHNNNTKYYKKFDIIINSDKNSMIETFIKGGIYKPKENPISTRLLTSSQLLNHGLGFIHKPGVNFYKYLKGQKELGKNNSFNERGINVHINLIDKYKKYIDHIQIRQEFDINNKKFYISINGIKINIMKAKNSKLGYHQALGKFMGDFSMILNVIQENSKKNNIMALGTIDKNAALIFTKLSEILGRTPRLFYIKQISPNPNTAIDSTPTLYVIGMNDIFSRRVSLTKIQSKKEFKRERRQKFPKQKNSSFVTGSANSPKTRAQPKNTRNVPKLPNRSQSSKNTKLPFLPILPNLSISPNGSAQSRSSQSNTTTSRNLQTSQLLNGKVNPQNSLKKNNNARAPQKNDPTSTLEFNSKRSASPKKSPPGSKRQKLQMNNT